MEMILNGAIGTTQRWFSVHLPRSVDRVRQINMDYCQNIRIVRMRQIAVFFGFLLFLATFLLNWVLRPTQILSGVLLHFIATILYFGFAQYLSIAHPSEWFQRIAVAMLGPVAAFWGIVSMVVVGGQVRYFYPLGVLFTILWTYHGAGVAYSLSLTMNIVTATIFLCADIFFLRYSWDFRLVYLLTLGGFSFVGYLTARFIQESMLENSVETSSTSGDPPESISYQTPAIEPLQTERSKLIYVVEPGTTISDGLRMSCPNYRIRNIGNGAEALDRICSETDTGFILYQPHQSAMNELEFLQRLRTRLPDGIPPVILIANRESSKHKLRMLHSGAVDVLQAPLDLDECRLKIEAWFRFRSTDNADTGTCVSELISRYALSSREGEVVRLVVRGEPRAHIAESLFISPNTVKSHVKAAYAKCGVRNRIELLKLLRNAEGKHKT